MAKMDVEAEGLAVYIAPVVLRMNLETVIIDKTATAGICRNTYSSVLSGRKFYIQDSSLNFHGSTLSLMHSIDSFDLLY